MIPSPANPQSWNRYSYVMNSPVNFNDPSGHECECINDPVCSLLIDAFVTTAIQVESPSGLNERPRWLFGGRRFTGIGPAKISDAEMEGEYGKLVDSEHEKTGLGLREGGCDRWKSCVMDQNKPEVAFIAMKTRLLMRLDICVKNDCTSTDMAMVALLAGDERVSPTTLNQAFKKPEYESANGITTLDWDAFMSSNWPKKKDIDKNNQLIDRFSNKYTNVNNSNLTKIDWKYIGSLAQ